MPWIWYRSASSWFASTSTLTSSNSPARDSASRSSTGPSMRQGPHQAAQKSTTTGSSCERSMTSRSKLSGVTFIGFRFSFSVRQRRAAAGVEVQELVERAEADRARGEDHRREREQHDPGDRAGADDQGDDDRRRCDEEAAEGAVAVVHVPGHLGLLAVV